MYEQDRSFVDWVLGCDHYAHSGYQVDIVQHDASNMYHGHYSRDHYDSECSSVENDEAIAVALQEEFSQIAIAESSESPQAANEQLQLPVHENDCQSSPTTNYNPAGYEGGEDDSGYLVPISSCSSPSEPDDYSSLLEQEDGYLLDDEVGKRLNQMTPLPHVPRINGEIPSFDEATSDHERLLSRLQLYGFVELKVQGDGNCQFRALSDQIYHTPEHHKHVRRQIVNQLKSSPKIYEGYVPMDYAEYLRKMSKSGEWGDHVTLQAAADLCGMKILVLTSFKDTCYIEILPTTQKWKGGVIFLSFWAEVHYNSLYFEDMAPSEEGKRKKKWWNFGG